MVHNVKRMTEEPDLAPEIDEYLGKNQSKLSDVDAAAMLLGIQSKYNLFARRGFWYIKIDRLSFVPKVTQKKIRKGSVKNFFASGARPLQIIEPFLTCIVGKKSKKFM